MEEQMFCWYIVLVDNNWIVDKLDQVVKSAFDPWQLSWALGRIPRARIQVDAGIYNVRVGLD